MLGVGIGVGSNETPDGVGYGVGSGVRSPTFRQVNGFPSSPGCRSTTLHSYGGGPRITPSDARTEPRGGMCSSERS